MSEYTDSVLAKFPDVPAALKKALAAALAAAEKAQPGTPVGKSTALKSGAMASEAPARPAFIPPDVEIADAAQALSLSEGITYSEAVERVLAEDSDLADRYARRFKIRQTATLSALPIPRGQRLIDRPADVELAETAAARAEADGISIAAAQSIVLAEDPALRSRYEDYRSRHSALDELAYRVETIRAAASARERMTEPKAVSLALSEDPTLKEAVFAYFESV